MTQNDAKRSAGNGKKSFFVQAAQASPFLFVLFLGLAGIEEFVARGDSGVGVAKHSVSSIWGLINLGLTVTGLILGIFGLCGIQKYGAKKILVPAVFGVCLNGLFLVSVGCAMVFAMVRARPRVLVDHSLTTKGYVIDGIPALDHAWDGKDYEKAGSVLSTLAENDPNILPRWKSAASAEVFARLVSDSNLEELRDKEMQAVKRLSREAAIGATIVSIEKSYADAAKAGAIYDDEQVEVARFALQWSIDMDRDMDDITGMMSADNPNREMIVHQFELGRRGLMEEIDGGIGMLEEGLPAQVTSLTRLADYEADLIPKLLGHMPKDKVQSWVNRVKAGAGREKNLGFAAALNHLAAELERGTP